MICEAIRHRSPSIARSFQFRIVAISSAQIVLFSIISVLNRSILTEIWSPSIAIWAASIDFRAQSLQKIIVQQTSFQMSHQALQKIIDENKYISISSHATRSSDCYQLNQGTFVNRSSIDHNFASFLFSILTWSHFLEAQSITLLVHDRDSTKTSLARRRHWHHAIRVIRRRITVWLTQ